jgi:hypothetical protein
MSGILFSGFFDTLLVQNEQMNVIGHDRPRTELVEPSLAFTHDYRLRDQPGDAGLIQPQGTRAISM